MAKTRGLRPRTLSFVFGAYFLLVITVAYFLSARVSVYVDPGATFWICAAYVLLGAVVLVGVSVGAVARWTRLDAHLAELEDAAREAVEDVGPHVPPPTLEDGVPSSPPTDQDVEQLLDDLGRIGESARAEAGPGEEPLVGSRKAPPATARPRGAGRAEIEHVRRVRDAVAAYATGPAIASIGLLGVFAALLPASDGMLLANLQLNAFVGLSGLGSLVGLLAYAGAAFAGRGSRGV